MGALQSYETVFFILALAIVILHIVPSFFKWIKERYNSFINKRIKQRLLGSEIIGGGKV